MKIFFGISSIALCVFFAYKFSNKYTIRKNFYNSFCEFNKKLKDEVAFSQTSIIKLIKSFSEQKQFYAYIQKYFLENIKPSLDGKIFSNDERDYFVNYLSGIGNLDRDTQISGLVNADKYLSEKVSLALEEEKKYKSLYIKLGFLLGLLIFVIIL